MTGTPHMNLRELARLAGVGKSTAQRALANDPRCHPDTRAKVRALAKEHGYRPDPVFATMASRRKRSGADGLPIAYFDCHEAGRHMGGLYAEPVRRRAEELGYRIEPVELAEWESPKRMWSVLFSRGVAGAIVGSANRERVPLLLGNERFPIVCAGRIDVMPYNTVMPSIIGGLKLAFLRMHALGYRRIGFALMRHDPELEDDFERHAAALACQEEFLKKADRVPILRAEVEDHAAVVEWHRKHRPDAVLGFHIGMFYVLRGAGVSIPGDTAFAALHLLPPSESTSPLGLIAGVNQNYDLIGRTAVNLIDQMVRHGEVGPLKHPAVISVESDWLDGKSLPKISL